LQWFSPEVGIKSHGFPTDWAAIGLRMRVFRALVQSSWAEECFSRALVRRPVARPPKGVCCTVRNLQVPELPKKGTSEQGCRKWLSAGIVSGRTRRRKLCRTKKGVRKKILFDTHNISFQNKINYINVALPQVRLFDTW
jgi:hypothetical protein